jgi:hypothetical protein
VDAGPAAGHIFNALSPYRTSVPRSTRAERYLATLERVPADDDPDRIRAALEASGAPPLDVWIDFQRRYGGLVEVHGFNRLEWGLIHGRPHPLSTLSADAVELTAEDGRVSVTCCSSHPSDHFRLDETGQLHWCFPPPVASSFEKHLEREALWWEIAETSGKLRAIELVGGAETRTLLLSNLEPYLVVEASDGCASVYRNQGVVAVERGSDGTAAPRSQPPGDLRVYVTGRLSREALRGVPHAAPFGGP